MDLANGESEGGCVNNAMISFSRPSTITEATMAYCNNTRIMMDDDDECGAIGEMLCNGNRSTRWKPQILHDLRGLEPGLPQWGAGD
jgi:hypothetical protein